MPENTMTENTVGLATGQVERTGYRSAATLACGLADRQRGLTRFGTTMVALAIPTLLLSVVDDREVLGVDVWIKPTKFFVSIGVYALTLAWASGFLTDEQRNGRLARSVIVVTVGAGALEQVIITVRAALGQQSHFNVGTPADAAWYTLMGAGAVLLTSTAAVTGLQVWRSGVLHGARRIGWAAGLFVGGTMGGLTGAIMSSHDGHWVGTAGSDRDGLPFLGWSTTVGDLRIAHFLGLHAMFVLPVIGWAADRRWADRPIAGRVTWAATLLWVGAVIATFANAAAGNQL